MYVGVFREWGSQPAANNHHLKQDAARQSLKQDPTTRSKVIIVQAITTVCVCVCVCVCVYVSVYCACVCECVLCVCV